MELVAVAVTLIGSFFISLVLGKVVFTGNSRHLFLAIVAALFGAAVFWGVVDHDPKILYAGAGLGVGGYTLSLLAAKL